MAATSTSGQKTSAQTAAKAAPAALVAGSHTFVAMQPFNFCWQGHVLTFNALNRYVVEAPLKAAISATGADVVWDN